jgi:hypothetical protein
MSALGQMSEDLFVAGTTQRVSNGIFGGPLFIGAVREINIFPSHLIAMAPANDAEQQRRAVCCTTLVHSAEMTPSQQAELESKRTPT